MYANLETTRGLITLRLRSNVAPETVKNFVKLAREGFYDGTKWHRAIPNFVIQGGCPEGTGKGGPGYTIDAELSEEKHTKGTVAMARGKSLDSAGSQFYIARSTLPHLDGEYTVFGQVTSGLEILDKIEKDDELKRVTIIEM